MFAGFQGSFFGRISHSYTMFAGFQGSFFADFCLILTNRFSCPKRAVIFRRTSVPYILVAFYLYCSGPPVFEVFELFFGPNLNFLGPGVINFLSTNLFRVGNTKFFYK